MNLSAVPVLAEPSKASGAEPGNTTHTRGGEARESINTQPAGLARKGQQTDSRGGAQKSWVFTFRVEPPPHTVSIRFGSSVMFGWYSRLLRQWYLVTGDTLEKIEEPPMMFVDSQWAKEHPRRHFVAQVEKVRVRKSKKPQQLKLFG